MCELFISVLFRVFVALVILLIAYEKYKGYQK